MNKIISGIFLILMALSISSCKSDLDSLADGHHRGMRLKHLPQVKTIKMSFGGDYITESEEPLLRAEDGDGRTFVGINVFYTESGKGEEDEQPYAYGLFPDPTTISIDLLTGYTYRFEATILIERVDVMYEEQAYPEYFYGEPFKINNGQNAGFKKSDMEKFIYAHDQKPDQIYHFTDLASGTAYVTTGNDIQLTTRTQLLYPRVKRFYGKLDEFELTDKEGESITIPMEYKSFGLKFVLKDIPADTSVTVQDISDQIPPSNDPKFFLLFHNGVNLDSSSEESKSWEGLFSLNDLTTNSHEFTLKFTWDKGHGDTETFTYKLIAEAKKKKILNIQINGDVKQIKSGNIVFSSLDNSLTNDEEDVSNNQSNE